MTVREAYDVLHEMQDEAWISLGSSSVKTDDGIKATEIHCVSWGGWSNAVREKLQNLGCLTSEGTGNGRCKFVCYL